MNRPYCTLVFARIVQDSPLNIGGNRPNLTVDSPFARDGLGRPVLRGSSLAGSFMACARDLAGTLPAHLSGIGHDPSSSGPQPSSWKFAHAHLCHPGTAPQLFQHVSIDPRTQAARDDALFNLEALPTGTAWHFLLEILPQSTHEEALAAAVLQAWSRAGGIRLGRGTSHGYGWCHLTEVTILSLDSRHAQLWPDALAAPRQPEDWVDHLVRAGVPRFSLAEWLERHRPDLPRPAQARTHTVELSGTIMVGERQDSFGHGYGLDTLSIGGHQRLQLQSKALHRHIIAPRGIPFPEEAFNPDFPITATTDATDDPDAPGTLRPYVPGASIRGVWRHMLERQAQAGHICASLVKQLFGSTDQAGALSVGHATLLADPDWRLLWQQHVAIDELTGGAYASAKFDRLTIAQAGFTWRARITADTPAAAERLAEPIRRLLREQGDGHLPLGGGIWRGHGHIRWTLDMSAGEHA